MIPIAGSAYTYTYATMGELIAWIIGWDLILEYAGSNMTVSVGFAAHIVDLLDWFGFHPSATWISPAYLPEGLQDLAGNWLYNPGWHFGFNIPAFLIVLILTVVLVRGIRESAEHQQHDGRLQAHRHPHLRLRRHQLHPSLATGIPSCPTAGAACSPAAPSSSSPTSASTRSRPRPRSAKTRSATCPSASSPRWSSAPCFTSRSPSASPAWCPGSPWWATPRRWSTRSRSSPAARRPLAALGRLVVLFGAIMGMLSSILVYQLGQSRVWFSMSRDGLLPKIFSSVHPVFRTPAFSTWVAGIVVAIPSGLFDIGTLADLSNIGTLFAFVLVSIGVIVLRYREPERRRGFRVPFGPVIPALSVVFCFLLMAGLPIITWFRFVIWLVIGLVIYFFYSRHRSEFAKTSSAACPRPSCICTSKAPFCPPRWWS
jgi:APA family basic amino acid/polyamine antiporter